MRRPGQQGVHATEANKNSSATLYRKVSLERSTCLVWESCKHDRDGCWCGRGKTGQERLEAVTTSARGLMHPLLQSRGSIARWVLLLCVLATDVPTTGASTRKPPGGATWEVPPNRRIKVFSGKGKPHLFPKERWQHHRQRVEVDEHDDVLTNETGSSSHLHWHASFSKIDNLVGQASCN